jgi:hypothetical protein
MMRNVICTFKCSNVVVKITIEFRTDFHLLFHLIVIFIDTIGSKHLEVHVFFYL